MSYFARLREQSELTVRRVDTAPVATRPGRPDTQPTDEPALDAVWATDIAAATTDLEVIELVERRSADHIALPIVRRDNDVAAAPEPVAPMGHIEPSSRERDHVGRSRSTDVEPVTETYTVAPGKPTPSAERHVDVSQTFETTSRSAEGTLRHVLEWIAAAPQRQEAIDTPIEASVLARATAPDPGSRPAVRSIGSPPSGPTALPHPGPPAATVPVTRSERREVQFIDPPGERGSNRTAAGPAAVEQHASEDEVKETLTVSIGAIHLRVEAPAPPPVPLAPRQAAPARPHRAERRPASRLARHYLRP